MDVAPATERMPQSAVDGAGPASARRAPPRNLAEERQIREMLPVLDAVVGRLFRRLAPLVERDELASVGRAALVEIVRRHDPTLSPLGAFVTQRIEWAILDELRRMNHTRAVKVRTLALEAASRLLAARAAGPVEAAAPLPTEQDYRSRLRALLAQQSSAMATVLVAHSGELVDPSESPEQRVVRAAAAKRVRSGVADLPARERLLIERHYFGGECFDAIADDMGLSKSWVSRIHAQALERLGRRLRSEAS